MQYFNIVTLYKTNFKIKVVRSVVVGFLATFLCLTHSKTTKAVDLLVIRHGEAMNNLHKFYSSNKNNPGYRHANLTPNGQVQVRLLARNLRKKGYTHRTVSKIIYSPLPRTRQTAELLAAELGVDAKKVRPDARLQDIDVGPLEGTTTRNKVKDIELWLKENAIQGGEKKEDVMLRVMNVHNEFADKEQKTGHVMMITHYRPASLLLQELKGRKVFLPRGGCAVISDSSIAQPL